MSHEEAHLAAFVYGLILIDNKARELGAFQIPANPEKNVKPDIDCRALQAFVQQVGSRIMGNTLTLEPEMVGTD